MQKGHEKKDSVTGKEDPGEIDFSQTLQPHFKSYVACKDATKKLKGAKEDEDRQRRRRRKLRKS